VAELSVSITKRRSLIRGGASLWGAVACAVITSELYEDLLNDKEHFLLPRPLKYALLVGMALLTAEEVAKVRRRIEQVVFA
jgi:hypothetical protein